MTEKIHVSIEDALDDLNEKRNELLKHLKQKVEWLKFDNTHKNHAVLIEKLSARYNEVSKKIHNLESNYEDKKGSFLPSVYLTHYKYYIAKNRSLEQLQEDVKEADLSIEDATTSEELQQYWFEKKEIAEEEIKYRYVELVW